MHSALEADLSEQLSPLAHTLRKARLMKQGMTADQAEAQIKREQNEQKEG